MATCAVCFAMSATGRGYAQRCDGLLVCASCRCHAKPQRPADKRYNVLAVYVPRKRKNQPEAA